jgi:hypothetical protein
MTRHDRHPGGADIAPNEVKTKFRPLENKYMAIAAGAGFLLALLLTDGSLLGAFGAFALIAGIGWIAHRLLRRRSG